MVPASAPSQPSAIRSFLWDRRLRQLFLWCLPALIVGALLRISVTCSMPYGYTQFDTPDYLLTTHLLLTKHSLHIHSKRSFLTPILFSAPFALPIPALLTIPAAQHAMGLMEILIVGAIVRLWFKHWKWFVIPATLLVGANPMIIWYEHTLLGEAQYGFFVLASALAGSVWVKWPTRMTFSLFLTSLMMVTGTRLEGKVFFLVALGLVPFVFWGKWRQLILSGTIALAVMAAGFSFSGGRDGSPLLLATIIQLAPDHFKSAPELEPYLIPVRDGVRKAFPEYPGDLVKTAKRIDLAVKDCFKNIPDGGRSVRAKHLNSLCLEILWLHPVEVLQLPLVKFRLAVDAWSAYCWDDRYLRERQSQALTSHDYMVSTLSKGLTGKPRSEQELVQWVNEHYDAKRIQWFTDYQELWNNAWIFFRTPDHPLSHERWVHDFFGGVPGGEETLPGIPYFYFLALAGMLAAILRWRNLGCFHLMWLGCMLFICYAALMVAVTNARFRFGYEPFFVLYLLLLFDCLLDKDFWARKKVCSGGL